MGFIIILAIILIVLAILNIRIVPQAFAYVIERLGTYNCTWNTGLHFKIPFIDKVSKIVLLKEQVADFPPQPVITKDNVTMKIDTVVFFQITDPKLYCYGISNPMLAIENLTATTLRNIVGDLELDETLTSRDTINSKIRIVLDEATDAWGIKISRVELKNITPPKDIQQAMERQMRAERERRESILQAEGEKKSTILVAEGKKQSVILEAEAAKEAAIMRAEGEANAILKVRQAESEGLKMLKSVKADNSLLSLKSYETMQKVADGKATKIFLPTELSGIANIAAVLSNTLNKQDDETEVSISDICQIPEDTDVSQSTPTL